VSTPAIRALGATPLQGVGSTLPSIFPSSITGTIRYHRDGYVRWRVVAWCGAAGVLSSVAGALLSGVVPGGGHLLMIATAALVAFTAYRTARPAMTPVPVTPEGSEAVEAVEALPDADPDLEPRVEGWRLAMIGLAAGGLSGLLGIGGGILMVPAFSTWARLPLKDTIATSLAVVGILAVPGTITHALLGHIAWIYAIPLSVGVIPGAWLGAHITISSSDRRLRLTVGAMLGILSVVYAVGEILSWH
jgi:uncharacterized membrane protein YfcA